MNVLHEADAIINGERQDQYGAPEDSFLLISQYWDTYLQKKMADDEDGELHLKALDVAHMMTLMKIARMQGQAFKRDNYTDACGYLAIAADRLAPDHVSRMGKKVEADDIRPRDGRNAAKTSASDAPETDCGNMPESEPLHGISISELAGMMGMKDCRNCRWDFMADQCECDHPYNNWQPRLVEKKPGPAEVCKACGSVSCDHKGTVMAFGCSIFTGLREELYASRTETGAEAGER